MPPAAFASASSRGERSNILRVFLRPLRLALAFGALLSSSASPVLAASNVRITGLSDVAFSSVSFSSDTTLAENVCAYSNSSTNGYRVTATGTGSGGAFSLASGSNVLAYEVQWSAQSGKTSGVQLTAGVPLTGLTSTATQQACNAGPATSASLIVILRSSAVSAATAGTYNGSLTLLIAPE